MRAIYAVIAVFLALCGFFTQWYLCDVRQLCRPAATLEILFMILAAFAIGFAGSWLLNEKTFRFLHAQLGGLLRERSGLQDQLQLLEKENQSARKHVAEWQQEVSLLAQVKKVTEPLLTQAKNQVSSLEQELQQYQRRYENLKTETDTIRSTAEQLKEELEKERAREVLLKVDSRVEEIAEAVQQKNQTLTPDDTPELTPSRFTPATWQTRNDLTLISGIGPGIQKKLYELGIYSFQQISELTPQDIDRVAAALKVLKGRIGRDNWIGQAAALRIK